MAALLPILDLLYDLVILLVSRFDYIYEHNVLLNHHIPVEEGRGSEHPIGDFRVTCKGVYCGRSCNFALYRGIDRNLLLEEGQGKGEVKQYGMVCSRVFCACSYCYRS